MVLSAFLWAVAIVYYKKRLSHVDSLVASFFQWSVGVLPLAALSLATNSFTLPRETTYWWTVLYGSVGSLAVGSTVWLFILREEEATVLSSSGFIVPVIALLFGWQILGEIIRTESILGSALILAGVYLVNVKSSGREKRARAPKQAVNAYQKQG